MTQPHISLAAEKVGSIVGFPITNSLITTWIVMGILIFWAFIVSQKITTVPNYIQLITEMVIEGLHNLFTDVVGEPNVNKFFSLLASIFLFVIFGNWIGLLPGVGTIGFHQQTKFIPLFRGVTADLNTTFALALIAVVAVQYYGVKTLKASYFKKFLNLTNPIMFFVGILEIISEISRIISFAFRLFGNIFAGEVLLTVISFLIPFLAPIPFLGLEIFVGFIQALVFSMLTAVFINMAVSSHADH